MAAKKTRKELARVTRMSPKDILSGIGVPMFRTAYEHGMSLSAYLELLNPTEPDDKSGLDAFQRVLREANIVTRSRPAAGIYPDVFDDAFDGSPERRMLGIEWMRRAWLEVSFGHTPNARQTVLGSDDYGLGSSMRPWLEASRVRDQQIEPAVPLNEIVARTTPLDGADVRMVYLQDVNPQQKRMVRVGETAEVPRVVLKTSQNTVTLYKFGRAIEASYETIRRSRLDRVRMWLQQLAVQTEVDKVALVLDVLINGDGNPGMAALSHNLTALDPATAPNNLTLPAWLSYKLKFKNPYRLTHILAREGSILKVLLLDAGNANTPLAVIANFIGVGNIRPMNNTLADNVQYGNMDEAPAAQIVGFDSRFAVERFTEIGADIAEIESYAITQTRVLVLTEVEGYGKMYKESVRNLNLAA
jgi:hypothetical protein